MVLNFHILHRGSQRLARLVTLAACILLQAHLAYGQGAEPVRVGGDIKPPRKVKDAKPVYPDEARREKKQGTVILEVVIGADGKVSSAKVVRSLPALDRAAIEAVQQWQYAPTIIGGRPTPVIMTVALNFAL